MILLRCCGAAKPRDVILSLVALAAWSLWFGTARVKVEGGVFSYRALPFLSWSVRLPDIASVKVGWAMSGWTWPHKTPHLVVEKKQGGTILVPAGILPELALRSLADGLQSAILGLSSPKKAAKGGADGGTGGEIYDAVAE